VRTPTFVEATPVAQRDDVVAEIAHGLLAPAAWVSPRHFYDALGSRLFDAITELDEYYPTRTEAAIFGAERAPIAAAVRALLPARWSLLDLGAGNCAKAARLFDDLAPRRYVAVDIAADFLRQSLQRLQREHPAIEMVGVGLDFSQRLALPDALVDGPALVFYPGSSIGNFDPPAALRLLREARALAAGGALLIGVDLVKPPATLEAAYDDELGVTAAFNLNLLRHLNRLIGSDFAPRQWRHVARFDVERSRVEMHLEARHALTVRWPGAERRFAAGERIHTENSYKWTAEAFETLLREAGYTQLRRWTDARGWYALMLASG
jgi:L-histidine Nalpha-methyltransferase